MGNPALQMAGFPIVSLPQTTCSIVSVHHTYLFWGAWAMTDHNLLENSRIFTSQSPGHVQAPVHMHRELGCAQPASFFWLYTSGSGDSSMRPEALHEDYWYQLRSWLLSVASRISGAYHPGCPHPSHQTTSDGLCRSCSVVPGPLASFDPRGHYLGYSPPEALYQDPYYAHWDQHASSSCDEWQWVYLYSPDSHSLMALWPLAYHQPRALGPASYRWSLPHSSCHSRHWSHDQHSRSWTQSPHMWSWSPAHLLFPLTLFEAWLGWSYLGSSSHDCWLFQSNLSCGCNCGFESVTHWRTLSILSQYRISIGCVGFGPWWCLSGPPP